jgi:hypothetical protein
LIADAARVAAFFVDQVTTAPVVLQCAQPVPEPWWKWRLTLAAEILGPLLSTAGSIYVAWKLFGWQGAKDRETWIRDREMAEWGAVLARLTAVDIKMPHVFENIDWPKLTDGMLQELRNVLPAMRNAVFISDELEKENLIDSFRGFVSGAAERIEKIDGLTEAISGTAAYESVEYLSEVNKIRFENLGKREAAYRELFDGFHAHSDEIRKIARAALLLRDGGVDQDLPTVEDHPGGPAAAGKEGS